MASIEDRRCEHGSQFDDDCLLCAIIELEEENERLRKLKTAAQAVVDNSKGVTVISGVRYARVSEGTFDNLANALKELE